jgi:hypothetical protein
VPSICDAQKIGSPSGIAAIIRQYRVVQVKASSKFPCSRRPHGRTLRVRFSTMGSYRGPRFLHGGSAKNERILPPGSGEARRTHRAGYKETVAAKITGQSYSKHRYAVRALRATASCVVLCAWTATQRSQWRSHATHTSELKTLSSVAAGTCVFC